MSDRETGRERPVERVSTRHEASHLEGELFRSAGAIRGEPREPSCWETADQRLWAVDDRGVGLAVALCRQKDRFAHALYALPNAAETPSAARDPQAVRPVLLLASQEGSDQDHWPASPPLQQLIVEPRGAGRDVALLLGMAGASHWSLSIDVDAEGGMIVFEAACRCASSPAELGSRYWLHPANRSAARGLFWHLPGGVEVELFWPDSRGEWYDEEPAASHWSVRPADLPTGPWPSTIQWNYAVRWSPAAS